MVCDKVIAAIHSNSISETIIIIELMISIETLNDEDKLTSKRKLELCKSYT